MTGRSTPSAGVPGLCITLTCSRELGGERAWLQGVLTRTPAQSSRSRISTNQPPVFGAPGFDPETGARTSNPRPSHPIAVDTARVLAAVRQVWVGHGATGVTYDAQIEEHTNHQLRVIDAPSNGGTWSWANRGRGRACVAALTRALSIKERADHHPVAESTSFTNCCCRSRRARARPAAC